MSKHWKFAVVGACLAACNGGGRETSGASETATTTSPATSDSSGGTGGGTSTSTTGEPTTGLPTSTDGSATGTSGTATGGTGGTSLPAFDLPPPMKQCSADLHAVVDDQGQLIETCAPDQGCADGACVAACEAAAASQANFACSFMVPTPPAYPPVLPPCFAAFLANTWGHPAKLTVQRGGVPVDVSGAARIATPGMAPKDWPPVPVDGIPADAVAVVFLSSDPKSIFGETQVPMTCPVPDATGASTVIKGSGRGQAFVIASDIPLTAYDILPFGGAESHFPSAELLFPTTVWGTNYVATAAPAGTYESPGPLWLQIVGSQDGTTVQLRPTVDLLQGTGLNGAIADQLAVFELGAGEVLQWELPQNKKDPAGTLVLSDKPVALFTGNRLMRLQPAPAPGGESVHQQNSAVSALGFEYVAAPYETRRKDLAPEVVEYRLVGVVDGTTLTYDPPQAMAPATLDKGQVVDFGTAEAFRVRSQDDAHPYAVAQLMDTANLPGGTRPGATAPGYPPALGDEEFVIVLPPAQFLSRYVFFTDPTYPTTNLVLTRVKQDGVFHPVTVDCLGEIAGWQPVGQDGLFEFTTVDLMRADVGVGGCTNGHHAADSKGPFGLVVWGLDSYSSYAYPAGGSASALTDVVVIPG